jgi:hypothetical protein
MLANTFSILIDLAVQVTVCDLVFALTPRAAERSSNAVSLITNSVLELSSQVIFFEKKSTCLQKDEKCILLQCLGFTKVFHTYTGLIKPGETPIFHPVFIFFRPVEEIFP